MFGFSSLLLDKNSLFIMYHTPTMFVILLTSIMEKETLYSSRLQNYLSDENYMEQKELTQCCSAICCQQCQKYLQHVYMSSESKYIHFHAD